MEQGPDRAFAQQFVEIGVPATTVSMRFVHGFAYSRLVPLVGAESRSTRTPPAFAIKLVSRIHPEFRRRTKAARQSLAHPPWKPVVDHWFATREAELVAINSRLQSVDLEPLSPTELAAHAQEMLDHCAETYVEHFRLHGADLGAIGQLAHACRGWQISAAEIVGALSGASPHTSEPALLLEVIRAELASHRAANKTMTAPQTLDELRSTSPKLAELVDAYLARQGWVIYSRYDLDGLTLAETPDLLLTTIVGGSVRARTVDHSEVITTLRQRVPAPDQERFDHLVAEARMAMGMRDSQGPLTIEWPTGLLRRVMLEVGRRAHRDGYLDADAHVFECTSTELIAMAEGGPGPGAAAMADRAARRQADKLADPPRHLGPDVAPAPLNALPPELAELTSIVSSVMEDLGLTGEPPSSARPHELTGTGIGTASFTGVARVATSPEVALAELVPGEVLVTLTTTPAYNLVLSMVGGLITAEGGPVCHAAVLSRELGIPAVIGVSGALTSITTGDVVEIDPVIGQVRIVG